MIIFKNTYWFALALSIISCAGNEDTSFNTSAVISFAAGIDSVSRAATNILQTRFSVNNRMAVYINEITSETPSITYDQPMQYRIIDTQGSMAPVNAQAPYYPTNGHPVTISAVFPYTAITSDGVFKINTKQDETNNYQASDLMFAKTSGRNLTGAMNLLFKHATSKITVNVTTDDDNIDISYSRINILNTMTSVQLYAEYGSIGSAYGNKESILISTDGSQASSGIILPQRIEADTKFIEIELLTKEKVYGVMPSAYTFEAGKSYVFNINVQIDRNPSIVTLSNIEVIDWADAYSTPQEITGKIKQ